MIDRIAHRGPDDNGLAVVGGGRTVIGNTRLAILDLTAAGHQPMRDESNGNVIVFNGEIYNHHEVRHLLRDRRYRWTSSSDTETVLRGYAAFGESCVDYLRGMFAFCIWDEHGSVLFCARDRAGIKPFYYYTDGTGVFVFASEVRALLASGQVARKIDFDGLAGLVRFGSVPEPLTLIEGIQSLPAAHRLRVQSGRIINTEQFWYPASSIRGRGGRPRNDDREAIQNLRRHLERSVSEHLLSDVPVATFLSGGLDSSVITALAANASSRPIHTITLGFHDREFDETAYAAAVSRRYRTNPHVVLLSDEEVIELIPEAVRRFDLPSLDGINTYIVSRAAVTSNIKVVLSGLGGDELFGGYRSFRLLKWADRLGPFIRWTAPLSSRALSRAASSYQRGLEMLCSRDLTCSYTSLRSLWSRTEMHRMGLNAVRLDPSDAIGTNRGLFSQISWLELVGYMRSTLLRDSDAMSMAQSIEMRVPLLDSGLVEWCLEVGAADYSRGSGKKLLLSRATADLIPPDIRTRRKHESVGIHGSRALGEATSCVSTHLPSTRR